MVNRNICESCRVNYRDSKYAQINEIPIVFVKINRFGSLDQVSIDIAKQLYPFLNMLNEKRSLFASRGYGTSKAARSCGILQEAELSFAKLAAASVSGRQNGTLAYQTFRTAFELLFARFHLGIHIGLQMV